ncbi:tRNA1(Val) [Rhizophlyctis rosea]|uniref:tRNA1(Val) n=1 Tax=Rhizophlyctis rosea TaxID=64517 RepID=A0AAD5X4D3_9FUNG|nr:tRNA1(Val) [Rhizophlyctis rosea]
MSARKPTPRKRAPTHFSMIREFTPADLITLCNSASGTTSIFASLKYVTTGNVLFLYSAILLVPIAFFFDAMDGRIARFFKTDSALGRELDSLSDIISFGVAPAIVGFAVGLQGLFDVVFLLYFVNCGVSRLARYNVTAETNTDKTKGKVTFFEGTPIPTTCAIVLGLLYFVHNGQIGDDFLPLGKYIIFGWTFHPLSLVYAISGTLMVSKTLRIPKP